MGAEGVAWSCAGINQPGSLSLLGSSSCSVTKRNINCPAGGMLDCSAEPRCMSGNACTEMAVWHCMVLMSDDRIRLSGLATED